MKSARVKNFDVLFFQEAEAKFSRAVSAALKAEVWNLERGIAKAVKDNFFCPENPARYSSVYFKQKKGQIYSAELSYRHKAIPLSRYPVKQYRITTGRRILNASRLKGSGAFKQRIVSRATIRTDVKIRRNSKWQTVEGKRGHMGWLHTGRKKGETGYNGQLNLFSSNIFERNQQATWSGGVRLPIHRLFGPSVSDLVQTKEVQKEIDKIFTNSTLLDDLWRNLQH